MNCKYTIITVFFSIFISGYARSQSSSGPEDRILTPVEDLRISDSEEHFIGRISDLAIGANNEIYVADNSMFTIHKYDAEGNFLKEIGREGRGPGEFLYIGGIKTFPDGRLATWDQRNQRINVYKPDGEYIISHIVNAGTFAWNVFEVSPEGDFFVLDAIFNRNTSSSENRVTLAWSHFLDNGELIEAIAVPQDPKENTGFVRLTASGPAFSFREAILSRLSPMGYMIVGNNSSYKLELRKPSGLITISHDYTPVKIKTEEEKQWKEMLGIAAGRTVPNSDFDVDTRVPETKPVYKQILTDSEGRIWIHRFAEAEYSEAQFYGKEGGWWEPGTFDIFLDDGSFYGSVKFPHGFNFVDAKGEYAYGVLTTDDLTEHVVRYNLSPQ